MHLITFNGYERLWLKKSTRENWMRNFLLHFKINGFV